jgi:hypothetical protein
MQSQDDSPQVAAGVYLSNFCAVIITAVSVSDIPQQQMREMDQDITA